MDGGQTNRTYSFTSNFGKTLNLHNIAKVHDYEMPLYTQMSLWKKDIIEDLKKNKNVVIPSMNVSYLKDLTDELIELFPEKKIKLYTGNTDSKVKMADASDVVKAWGELDCLLYSPCFEAGVNFPLKHFDSLYPMLSCGSCSQESFFQMISRVRHFTSNIIKTYKGDIPDYDFSDFWNFEEVKAGMIESRDAILKPMYVKHNGYTERQLKLEPYNINAIYNKIEDLNKNSYYFMAYFRQLGARKGYKIYDCNDLFLEEEDTEERDTRNKLKPILEAKDIDQEEFNVLLDKQRKNTDTEAEKMMIEKEMYKRDLGLDMLNEDVMKCYYRKTNSVKNYIKLLDDDAIHYGNTQHADESNSRLDIVRNLIKLLGWKSATDRTVLNDEQFKESIIGLVGKSKAFTDPKTTKMLFGMSKCKIETTNLKQALRYINELFKNFGVKIDVSYKGRREPKNMLYQLVELNNISEIVFYLINKRKCIFGENSHFIEPKEFRFKSLYIERPIIAEDRGEDMFNDE